MSYNKPEPDCEIGVKRSHGYDGFWWGKYLLIIMLIIFIIVGVK